MPFILTPPIPEGRKQKILEYIPSLDIGKEDIYVLESFSGDEFTQLFNEKKFMIGAELLQESLEKNISLPVLHSSKPAVFSAILTGVVISTSQLTKSERNSVTEKAMFMGARVTHSYTSSVTHLITNTSGTQKYQLAIKRGDFIITPQWINDCWEKNTLISENLYKIEEPMFKQTKPSNEDTDILPKPDEITLNSKHYTIEDKNTFNSDNNLSFIHSPKKISFLPLSGCVICVSGYSSKQRYAITKIATDLGAIYSVNLQNNITHFLCENPLRKKFEEAKSIGVKYCVSGKWLEECNNRQIHVDESDYIVSSPFSNNDDDNNSKKSKYSAFEDITKRFNVQIEKPGFLFSGINFTTDHFDYDQVCDISDVVTSYGGNFQNPKSKISFLILPHGKKSNLSSNSSFIYVSPNWIERCIEEGKLLDPQSHILFRPLSSTVPMKGTRGKSVSISGITSKERRSLRMLLTILGFKYEEKLTRNTDYLITKPPLVESEKYKGAKEWNIPLLHSDWVIQSAQVGYLLRKSPFYILPNLPLPQEIVQKKDFPQNYNTNQKNTTFSPSQEVSWMSKKKTDTPILLGVTIYISPRIKNTIKEQLEKIAVLVGASIQRKLSQAITHLIESNVLSEIEENDHHNSPIIHSPARIKSLYSSILFVSPKWLFDCFEKSLWLPENEYPPALNPSLHVDISSIEKTPLKEQQQQPVLRKRSRLEVISDFPSPSPLPPIKRQKTKLKSRNVSRLFKEHNNDELTPEEKEAQLKNTIEKEFQDLDDIFMNDIITDDNNTITSNNLIVKEEEKKEEEESFTDDSTDTMIDEKSNLSQNISSTTNGIEDTQKLMKDIEEDMIDGCDSETETAIDHMIDSPIIQSSNILENEITLEKQEIVEPEPEKENINSIVLGELEKLLTSGPDFEIQEENTKGEQSRKIESKTSTNRIALSDLYKNSGIPGNNNNTSEEIDFHYPNDKDMEELIDDDYHSDECSPDSQVVIYRNQQIVENNTTTITQDDSNVLSIESVCKLFDKADEYCFGFSGISNSKKIELKNIVLKLGGSFADDSSLSKMTHLIVTKPSRSLKYLSGLAKGCWILSPDYLYECRKQNNWIKNLEKYEIKDSSDSSLSRAKYWRTKIKSNPKEKPFYGMQIALFAKNFENDISQVLALGGGEVKYRFSQCNIDSIKNINNITTVIFDDALLRSNSCSELLNYFQKHSISCISARYIADCLSKSTPVDISYYTISIKKVNK